MGSQSIARAAIAAITVLCVAVACNGEGGGSMTLEEYFTQLERLEADIERRGEALEDPFSLDGGTPRDEWREAVLKLKEEAGDIFDDYRDGYADLDPPDEVADLHEEYRDGIDEFVDEYNALLDRYADADSADDVVADESSEFIAALDDVTGACQALQDLAADNDIEVDLRCETD